MIATVKTKTTLDTIALKCDVSLLKDFEYTQEAFKSNNGTDDFDNKYYRLILKDTIKDLIFGLEKLELVKKERSQGVEHFIKLVINAKLLNTRYLEGLNIFNIKTALEYLTKKLKDFIKIKVSDILNKFQVGYCDFTKNIKVSDYSIIEYLKSINYHIVTSRSLKRIRTAFIENGTLNLMLSNKERFIIYDKNNELESMINDSKHKYFINSNKELLKLSENILRLETRIIGSKRLSKILNIKLKNDSDYITLNQILNSNNNIGYERLKSYIPKKQREIIDINYKSMENIKDFKKYHYGKSLFTDYHKDYNKLKADVFSIITKNENNKNKIRTARNNYYNSLDSINYYLCFNELRENKINYSILFNEVLEKLKVA